MLESHLGFQAGMWHDGSGAWKWQQRIRQEMIRIVAVQMKMIYLFIELTQPLRNYFSINLHKQYCEVVVILSASPTREIRHRVGK